MQQKIEEEQKKQVDVRKKNQNPQKLDRRATNVGKYQTRSNLQRTGTTIQNNKDLENNSKPDLTQMINEEKKKQVEQPMTSPANDSGSKSGGGRIKNSSSFRAKPIAPTFKSQINNAETESLSSSIAKESICAQEIPGIAQTGRSQSENP